MKERSLIVYIKNQVLTLFKNNAVNYYFKFLHQKQFFSEQQMNEKPCRFTSQLRAKCVNYRKCKISPLRFLWHNIGSLFVSIHIAFPSQPNKLQPLIATRSKQSRSFQQKSINVSKLFKRSE